MLCRSTAEMTLMHSRGSSWILSTSVSCHKTRLGTREEFFFASSFFSSSSIYLNPPERQRNKSQSDRIMKSSFSVTSVVHRQKSEGFTEFSVEKRPISLH